MRRTNCAGIRFGRLVVIELAEKVHGRTAWLCACDCGKQVIVSASNLVTRNTQSCGCIVKEKTSGLNFKHGMSKARIYLVWRSIIGRCKFPSHSSYPHYGGRGITVCQEWNDFDNFLTWALCEGYERGLTVDRIDNDGNYSPENCRVVDYSAQARNTRRNRMITAFNKTQCLIGWAEDTGIKRGTIAYRLNAGWKVEKALTLPPKGA